MGQQSDVNEYLMAEHIDVQLVGDVPNEFHKQFTLVQLGQSFTAVTDTGRTAPLWVVVVGVERAWGINRGFNVRKTGIYESPIESLGIYY